MADGDGKPQGRLARLSAWADRKKAEQDAWMEEQQARNEAEKVGLVAHHAGVRLYEDRIEHGDERRPLAGVRARVEEQRTGAEWGGIGQKKIWLTVTGPGFEWPVNVAEIVSSRKAREFAAKVNAASSAVGEVAYVTDADFEDGEPDLAGQLERVAELHRSGALTDDEYSSAKARLLGWAGG